MNSYTTVETIFQAKNINHYLDDKLILRNISFEIKNTQRDNMNQGQIVALLGPSGCGKTQLFRILSGLTYPKEGQVLLGDNLDEVKPGDVGVIAQDYPLFFNKSIYDNLSLALSQSDMDKCHHDLVIRDALYRFNIIDKMYQYPGELSGGQRQRVAILQQILCGHKFLLMDEPFSGLDIVMRNEVRDMINEISLMDEENTIIIITHNIEEAASIADEIWIMGFDKDENGNDIEGAIIQKEFDLKQMGLSWSDDISHNTEFRKLVEEIENIFKHI